MSVGDKISWIFWVCYGGIRGLVHAGGSCCLLSVGGSTFVSAVLRGGRAWRALRSLSMGGGREVCVVMMVWDRGGGIVDEA